MRRSIWIPPLIWSRVVAESKRETQHSVAEGGEPVGYSEIVRRAILTYLGTSYRCADHAEGGNPLCCHVCSQRATHAKHVDMTHLGG
jgi:hypothetical protein